MFVDESTNNEIQIKSCIRETQTFLTSADRSTDTKNLGKKSVSSQANIRKTFFVQNSLRHPEVVFRILWEVTNFLIFEKNRPPFFKWCHHRPKLGTRSSTRGLKDTRKWVFWIVRVIVILFEIFLEKKPTPFFFWKFCNHKPNYECVL